VRLCCEGAALARATASTVTTRDPPPRAWLAPPCAGLRARRGRAPLPAIRPHRQAPTHHASVSCAAHSPLTIAPRRLGLTDTSGLIARPPACEGRRARWVARGGVGSGEQQVSRLGTKPTVFAAASRFLPRHAPGARTDAVVAGPAQRQAHARNDGPLQRGRGGVQRGRGRVRTRSNAAAETWGRSGDPGDAQHAAGPRTVSGLVHQMLLEGVAMRPMRAAILRWWVVRGAAACARWAAGRGGGATRRGQRGAARDAERSDAAGTGKGGAIRGARTFAGGGRGRAGIERRRNAARPTPFCGKLRAPARA
jgi:hypothetical protein